METNLTKMTNAELWELFPVILTEHDPRWEEHFRVERALIESCVGKEAIVRFSHIGSTAVPRLVAKPTVDMLLEIADGAALDGLKAALKGIGYLFSPQPENPALHMMFLKGYTPQGFCGQAYHLHVRYGGDWDELYFRDWLRMRPEVAAEYGALKRELQTRFAHDRDGYTEEKTAFIREATAQARAVMGGRYAANGRMAKTDGD